MYWNTTGYNAESGIRLTDDVLYSAYAYTGPRNPLKAAVESECFASHALYIMVQETGSWGIYINGLVEMLQVL